ncbi:MAG: hypothetical protein D6690_18060 [Nitrospirae bacterium]|nr:MAG: hypothetical protein D6690_18060 [Nitrospirota bacterium]
MKLALVAAKRCVGQGPNVEAEVLLDWTYCLRGEEGDSDFKVLMFTKFAPAQKMLRDFLAERGEMVCHNGSWAWRSVSGARLLSPKTCLYATHKEVPCSRAHRIVRHPPAAQIWALSRGISNGPVL